MSFKSKGLPWPFPVWATTSLTVLFGLQLLRVLFASLVGYLRDARDIEAMNLAPLALGIFAVSFLAAILRRVSGPRMAIMISAGGVALARVIEQISTSPALDLVLSASGVGLFLLYVPNGLGAARAREGTGTTPFGVAFLLGMAADTAIHIGARTLDLSWQPGILPLLIVALLAAVQIWAMVAARDEPKAGETANSDASWRRTLGLIALGPWLFLQMQVFQNVARVSALTGWETPAAGALVVLGNAWGILAAIWITHQFAAPLRVAVQVAFITAASLIIPEPRGLLAVPLLLVGQVSSLVLATVLFAQSGCDVERPGLARTTVAYGIGQILFVAIVFAYYITYDVPVGFRAPVLLSIAGVIAGILVVISSSGSRSLEDYVGYIGGAVALLMLATPLGLALFWSKPQAMTPTATNAAVRVIDYNVHNGFDITGRLDLERIAAIIEESEADVVGLQEISRGWLIWGSTDMLTWLSQRLGMPYVTGSTADAQWGNAVLSRYPIVRAEAFPLPPEELLIRRGYIVAEIDIGRGTITLIDTHFAHRSSSDAEREMQAAELVNAWDGAATTVIVGDMNAAPDADAMLILSDAGLVNVAAEFCPQPVLTSPAKDPSRQIDYIWISPDLQASECEVGQIPASDHFPVIATITLP